MLQFSTEQKSRCFRVFPCTKACVFPSLMRIRPGKNQGLAFLQVRESLPHPSCQGSSCGRVAGAAFKQFFHLGLKTASPGRCPSKLKLLVSAIQYFHFLGKIPATSENGPGPPPEPEDSPPPLSPFTFHYLFSRKGRPLLLIMAWHRIRPTAMPMAATGFRKQGQRGHPAAE